MGLQAKIRLVMHVQHLATFLQFATWTFTILVFVSVRIRGLAAKPSVYASQLRIIQLIYNFSPSFHQTNQFGSLV